MLPEAKGGKLVYAAFGCQGICIFALPSGKNVGAIDDEETYANVGLCSDSVGNVFATGFYQAARHNTGSSGAVVLEYPHGQTTPIAVLSVPGILAGACSVDPTTGNLAVIFSDSPSWGSGVAVFANAAGTPTIYGDAELDILQCGYDGSGNLFVGGNPIKPAKMRLAELRAGGSTLTGIGLNLKGTIGQIQWDGTYLAIENESPRKIDRVKVSGSKGTIIGVTSLGGVRHVALSWIQGGQVVAGDGTKASGTKHLALWPYPKGGTAQHFVSVVPGRHTFFAVTVSVAPSH